MKKQTVRHLLSMTILLVGLFFGIQKVSFAGGESKMIVATWCCLNGQQTGVSNDCDNGTGTCTDHNCLTGETEKPQGSCQ